MFGRKQKQIEREMKYLESRIDSLEDRHWNLYREHRQLLDHLNLKVVDIPKDTKIVQKDQK